jgi:dimethylhistidine N-methyltransferase
MKATLSADIRQLRDESAGDSQAFRRGTGSGSYLSRNWTNGFEEGATDLRSLVRRGLRLPQKRLPSCLLRDEVGSALFDELLRQPESYLRREEYALLEAYAEAIAEAVFPDPAVAPHVVDLGAGSALASQAAQVLLRAIGQRQGQCVYMPVDISPSALSAAEARLATEEPNVIVRPFVMTNEEAVSRLDGLQSPKLLMMLGSAMGHYAHGEAIEVLTGVRRGLGFGDALLLSTDMVRDDVSAMVLACNDAQGACAQFNKNVLLRMNREMGGCFDASLFRHVATWNAESFSVDMHLESRVAQTVSMSGVSFEFREGETIHTQQNVKYDMPRLDAVLRKAGLRRECSLVSSDDCVALHVIRPAVLRAVA